MVGKMQPDWSNEIVLREQDELQPTSVAMVVLSSHALQLLLRCILKNCHSASAAAVSSESARNFISESETFPRYLFQQPARQNHLVFPATLKQRYM